VEVGEEGEGDDGDDGDDGEEDNEGNEIKNKSTDPRDPRAYASYMSRQDMEENIRRLLKSVEEGRQQYTDLRMENQLIMAQLDFVKKLIGIDDNEIDYQNIYNLQKIKFHYSMNHQENNDNDNDNDNDDNNDNDNNNENRNDNDNNHDYNNDNNNDRNGGVLGMLDNDRQGIENRVENDQPYESSSHGGHGMEWHDHQQQIQSMSNFFSTGLQMPSAHPPQFNAFGVPTYK
jgi:hypothetical protein